MPCLKPAVQSHGEWVPSNLKQQQAALLLFPLRGGERAQEGIWRIVLQH